MRPGIGPRNKERKPAPSRRRIDIPRWGGALAAALGVVNLLSAVTPGLPGRLALLRSLAGDYPLTRFMWIGNARYIGHLAAALSGFGLLVLARGLWRRKFASWALALTLLSGSAAAHLAKGLDWEEAGLAAGLALLLWLGRSEFYARSDLPSVRRALQVLALSVVFTLAYGTVGFYLLDGHFRTRFGWKAAIEQTLAMFLEFRDPGALPVTRFGRDFTDSIVVIGACTLGYALLSLLRPVFLREPATPEERERARGIVERYGRTSLARMTLFDDKQYRFGPEETVIAYAVRNRVAVSLGDPIGPEPSIGPAIDGFIDRCRRNDWLPAFYQILPDALELYRERGLETLCIGHEALVDLDSFTLDGGAMKSLRSTVRRLDRDGNRAECCEPPHSDGLMATLRSVSDEWLAGMHGGEKRFSLGWFDERYLQTCPIMTVRAPDDGIIAFANIIPEYREPEMTIDLMRRRARAPNGTMEFLFVRLFEHGRERGFQSFNLGLSPLSGVGEHRDDPVLERGLHFLYEHLNRFYSFQGLHAFKEKFDPRWSPRFLAYPTLAALPQVALAIVIADSGRRIGR